MRQQMKKILLVRRPYMKRGSISPTLRRIPDRANFGRPGFRFEQFCPGCGFSVTVFDDHLGYEASPTSD
jgi:hypothetical protein